RHQVVDDRDPLRRPTEERAHQVAPHEPGAAGDQDVLTLVRRERFGGDQCFFSSVPLKCVEGWVMPRTLYHPIARFTRTVSGVEVFHAKSAFVFEGSIRIVNTSSGARGRTSTSFSSLIPSAAMVASNSSLIEKSDPDEM